LFQEKQENTAWKTKETLTENVTEATGEGIDKKMGIKETLGEI